MVTSITTCRAGWSSLASTPWIARQRWASPWKTMTLRTGSTASWPASLEITDACAPPWRPPRRLPAELPGPELLLLRAVAVGSLPRAAVCAPLPEADAPSRACRTGSSESTVVWRAE